MTDSLVDENANDFNGVKLRRVTPCLTKMLMISAEHRKLNKTKIAMISKWRRSFVNCQSVAMLPPLNADALIASDF